MGSGDNAFTAWKHDGRPSVMLRGSNAGAGPDGKTVAQRRSEQVEAQRAKGKSPGTIKGMGRKSAADRVLSDRFGGAYLKAGGGR